MSAWRFVKSPVFLWALRLLTAAAASLALWHGVRSEWPFALVWLAVAVFSAGCAFYHRALPPLLGLLLALAASVNGAGYTLSLWQQDTSFDELVHAFTTFAGMAVVGWLLARRDGRVAASRASLIATVLIVGLLLGILWEGFEMLAGMSGSIRDTVIDLVMDTLGSVVAAFLACWLASTARD